MAGILIAPVNLVITIHTKSNAYEFVQMLKRECQVSLINCVHFLMFFRPV